MITGINLITGLIGSGKSLHSIGLMQAEVDSGRPTFAANYKGLNIPGVIEIEDPRQWQDLPTGAVLFVDEAQRFWRVRRSVEIPAEIQAMETSRGEEGVSIVLVTQQPTYIDKHIRGLVTRHTHLFRRMGLNAAEALVWERCHDDPMSSTSKDGADKSVFAYPKSDFGKYKSAEVHTVKRNLGFRAKMIIAAFGVVAICVGYIVVKLGSEDDAAKTSARAPASASASPQAKAGAKGAFATADEYNAAMTPRVAMAPWTAPMFDGRKAVAKPELFCVVAGAGIDANEQWRDESCKCWTEQGTRFSVPGDQCRLQATSGPMYNPYRSPDRPQLPSRLDRSQRGAGVPPAETAIASQMALSAAHVAGWESQQSRYGQMRTDSIPGDPQLSSSF